MIQEEDYDWARQVLEEGQVLLASNQDSWVCAGCGERHEVGLQPAGTVGRKGRRRDSLQLFLKVLVCIDPSCDYQRCGRSVRVVS